MRHITEGIDLFRRTAFHQPLGNGLATLAWIRQTYGDTAAAGKSNQRIAHQLVVTLDTVKKHVSHILGKLGAVNRTEAVTRARELGVIP